MYPEQVNYNDNQINELYKTYFNKVNEKLHGGVAPKVAQTANNENATASPSAGFADIFVLTVIVLVYAVIIVNLILKL